METISKWAGPVLEMKHYLFTIMSAYGKPIKVADQIEEDMYTPTGSTPDTPDTTPGQTIGYQDGKSPYAGQVVDQTMVLIKRIMHQEKN